MQLGETVKAIANAAVLAAMSPLKYTYHYDLISEPRPDDDFIDNSESDISEASEIYPLLSNVSSDQENYIVYRGC